MIPLIEPLTIVQHYGSQFRDVLTEEEYRKMERYLSGLLVNGNKTVEGINKLFILDGMDQSTLNRLLSESHFEAGALNDTRLDWLQSCPGTAFKEGEGEKGVLVLDDTLLTHHGPHFEKIAWLYDHVSGSYCWAHNLVNLHYSDDRTDYPVDFRLWEPADTDQVEAALRETGCGFSEQCLRRKEEDPAGWRAYLLKKYNRTHGKPLKGKTLRKVYKTKIDLAMELLDAFYKKHPGSTLPAAFDHWYTCAELCAHIDKTLKRSYVGTLSADDVVLSGPQRKEMRCGDFAADLVRQHREAIKKGTKPLFEKVGIHYKGGKETYYACCQTQRIKHLGRQRLVVSFSKEDLSDKEPKYYVSNRLHWRSGGILRMRRHRWPIEVYHEEGKAEGLDKYQLRQFEGIKKHIALVCVAYSMLKRVRFDEEFLNKLQWKPEQQSGSLAFWRRVMTVNALMGFITWLLRETGSEVDWSHLVPKIAKAYL
jgi:DDE superfamily endonuclease